MSSTSTNFSSSQSLPVVTETPENAIMDQISGVAEGLAQQMNNWAQSTFAQTSQITDQAVNNFFNVSTQMGNLSNTLTNEYNNLFAPENAQLIADANSYASPSRMQTDMGMAGATQAQAGQAALANSEEALKQYGIDPSSGRYASLENADAVQNAANVAGAENTQRMADINTGQQLRAEAVQVGSQLPSAISNVNNTAIQANAGAENAELSNANTGANMFALPNSYLQTAMGVKQPLQGQKSSSSGGGNSNSNKPSQPSPNPNSGGQNFGASQGSGTSFKGMGTGGAGSQGIVTPYMGGGSNPFDVSGIYGPDAMGGVDASQWEDSYSPDLYGSGSMDVGYGDNSGFNDYSNPFDDSGFGQTLPSQDFGGADQTFGDMGGGTDTEWGNISYDPSANSYSDSGWTDPTFDPSGTDWGSGDTTTYSDPGGYDSYDSSGGSSDYSDYTGDYSDYSGDSGGGDYSYDDGGGDYAKGGLVMMRHAAPKLQMAKPPMNLQRGGKVPPGASPSRGARTDDVNAHVNVGEFVVPKDVVQYKGHEFFEKLIAQSRKARMGMGAHPLQKGMR